jgi:glutathione S-transferase
MVTKAAQFPGDDLWKPEWKPSFGEETIQRRSATKDSRFTLYSAWFCPFAQRAWIVAEECNVPYQWVEINTYEVNTNNPGGYTKYALSLADKDALYPGFVQASPRGLVPAIQHENNGEKIVVWESLPAAEYLDTVFGSGQLSGTTPLERAQIQIWSAHCTDRIQKHYYRALMAQDHDTRKQAIDQFYQECRALARAMPTTGPYFLGNRFSMVDVALAPFWERILWVGNHYFGLVLPRDDVDFERLDQWWEACRQRPSIEKTLVCKERLIASYLDYYQGKATSDFARNAMK